MCLCFVASVSYPRVIPHCTYARFVQITRKNYVCTMYMYRKVYARREVWVCLGLIIFESIAINKINNASNNDRVYRWRRDNTVTSTTKIKLKHTEIWGQAVKCRLNVRYSCRCRRRFCFFFLCSLLSFLDTFCKSDVIFWVKNFLW